MFFVPATYLCLSTAPHLKKAAGSEISGRSKDKSATCLSIVCQRLPHLRKAARGGSGHIVKKKQYRTHIGNTPVIGMSTL